MEINVKDLKNFLNGKDNIVVETTTVGGLKKRITERRNKLALGQGFKNEIEETKSALDNLEGGGYDSKTEETKRKPIKNKSTVNNETRKVSKKGSLMLGDGFKLTESMLKKLNLTHESVIDLVENIVGGLKGNNEYVNLKFVENVGKKYHMNESTIKEMKKIIWSENSISTGKKLYNYIKECACQQAQDVYQNYNSLNNSAKYVIPKIKGNFNINRKSMPLMQAIDATAMGLGLPIEMVEEMYNMQKESYKMQMEGGKAEDVDMKLHEIYEKYQKMQEGDMDEMYNEMAEMMDYMTAEDMDMDEMEETYGYKKGLTERDSDEDYMVYDMVNRARMFVSEEIEEGSDENEAVEYALGKYNISAQEFFEDDEELADYMNWVKGVSGNLEESETDMPISLQDLLVGDGTLEILGLDSDDLTTNKGYGDEDEMKADYEIDDYLQSNIDTNEEYDKFDEVYNEMESFIKENLGSRKEPVIIKIDNPIIGAEDQVEEWEIYEDDGKYIVNGEDPEGKEDFIVKVINGELENGEYLPHPVQLAILKMDMGRNPLEEKMDAVGSEDADIDNDGDVDSSDKYLKKRRDAIGDALSEVSSDIDNM